jgi:hypothetical protein
MRYMIFFLLACILLGLWVPPKVRLQWVVLVLAILLVAFFILAPHRA